MVQAPFYLSIAIPAPLPKTFDYLPLPDSGLNHYQSGLRVRVPFGGQTLIGVIVDIHHSPQISPHKLKPVIEIIDSKPLLPNDLYRLTYWLSEYYHKPLGECFELMWPILLRKGQHAEPSKQVHWQLSTATDLQEAETSLKRAPRQLALYRQFTSDTHSQKALIDEGFTPAVIQGLAEKGFIQSAELPSFQAIRGMPSSSKLPLNDDQQNALVAINAERNFHAFLLEGVTGSGKTEVYLQAIESVLAQGKQVMVLVPEIGLTPQTVDRFAQRFDADILVLHSKLTARERLDAWLCAKDADGKRGQIIIGTRSAVLTPAPHLGMIIIDEEHDASFKQQEGVRYHGRDFAVMRAKLRNVPIILGSATPSLDSLQNALSGKYSHLRLLQRAGKANPPQLRIFNLKHQPQQQGLADSLLAEIKNTLDKKQQVLVFVNQRGYAPTLYCPDCGWIAECKRCDAKLTLHHKPAHLHCHHCDAKQSIPRQCPQCLSMNVHPLGCGTERLEQHLENHFPTAPVIRIDRDSTSGKNSMEKLLEPVHAGDPCILVGTQMLAKGHHFPQVTLVITINVDSGFFSADFRAMEKTAQLLVQVTGRAGRDENKGTAIIQTEFADHPMLHLLVDENYHSLALALLQERHEQQLPPYGYQILMRADSNQPKEAEHFLHLVRQHFAQCTQQWQMQNIKLLGPLPSPMELRAGRFRSQLWVASPQRKALHRFIDQALPAIYELKGFHRVRWSLDVDPVESI